MRKNISLLGILFVISLISCEKEDDNKIITDSSFYATKNDSEWISTSSWANYSLNDKKIVIVGVKRDSVYYQDEQLHFTFKTTEFCVFINWSEDSPVSYHSYFYLFYIFCQQ